MDSLHFPPSLVLFKKCVCVFFFLRYTVHERALYFKSTFSPLAFWLCTTKRGELFLQTDDCKGSAQKKNIVCNKKWRFAQNCGNTTKTTTLLQQFIKKVKQMVMRQRGYGAIVFFCFIFGNIKSNDQQTKQQQKAKKKEEEEGAEQQIN